MKPKKINRQLKAKKWNVTIWIKGEGEIISCSGDLPLPFTDKMAKQVLSAVKRLVN